MNEFKSKNQEQFGNENKTIKDKANYRYEEKEKMQNVRLPELKKSKEENIINRKNSKVKTTEQK